MYIRKHQICHSDWKSSIDSIGIIYFSLTFNIKILFNIPLERFSGFFKITKNGFWAPSDPEKGGQKQNFENHVNFMTREQFLIVLNMGCKNLVAKIILKDLKTAPRLKQDQISGTVYCDRHVVLRVRPESSVVSNKRSAETKVL